MYSQHDQSILEEEYEKNERPDKYARRIIMEKIDLGEREIQVRDSSNVLQQMKCLTW